MPWALRMTMMAAVIALLPYLYVSWRFGASLIHFFPNLHREIRLILPAILLFIYLLPLIIGLNYITGSLQNMFLFKNELTFSDYIINFPFWIALLTMVEVLPYILVADISGLAARFFSERFYSQIKETLNILRLILPVVFLIFVLIRTHFDTNTIRASDYTIRLPGTGSPRQNLKLALVADLQVDRYTGEQKIKQMLDILDSEKNDFIFSAGDLVTRGTDFINQGIKALCAMEGDQQIACIGDHDIWSDASRISSALINCNWQVLANAHSVFEFEGRRILVTGVTYAYSQRISRARLDQLLQSAPAAELKILLVHQPAKIVLEAARKHGYDILLAGHTHGGQVVFKPFGITVTPTQAENEIFNGHTLRENLHIFVSNGIGLTMMPLRYRAFAEIVRIRVEF